MSERTHVLARELMGKPSIADCDIQEIRALVERYPYFAPAQFLLLEKMKEDLDPGYTAQLQKSVLYYHNPLAFEYFISSDNFYTEASDQQLLEQQEELQPFSSLIEPGDLNGEISVESDVFGEEEIAPEETTNIDIEPENTAPVIETEQTGLNNEILAEADESGETELVQEEVTNSVIEPGGTGEIIEQGTTELPVPHIELKAADPGTPVPAPELPSTSNEPLAFEPFHTVDYFASQGIKLSQEEVPKDKFGKQLKSFTEWLKTMKRLPVKEQAIAADTGSEQKVQHLAEDSVHEADVVTEAMAEVWLKQGNTQKALEIYQQLSLLNPSKNAYFAALIEKLKRS